MESQPESKQNLPPFTLETAKAKVQAAEDAWNTRDPGELLLAYTEIHNGGIVPSSSTDAKRSKLFEAEVGELDYRLRKELWALPIIESVRFEYEWHDDSGHWYRSYGNEQEFAENGLMRRREASINDVPIQESERKFRFRA